MTFQWRFIFKQINNEKHKQNWPIYILFSVIFFENHTFFFFPVREESIFNKIDHLLLGMKSIISFS